MSAAGETPLPFLPLVIIGAGRSGTNILRDSLTRLDGFATWPCDEINPIWRHGNLAEPHDEFDAGHARPAVRTFIRRAFLAQWRRSGMPAVLVEKTCANTLRMDFVAAVLPEARYVVLTRDGRDVVQSAERRWRGDMELPSLPYFLAKARFVPVRDLPYYGWRFLRARVAMLAGAKRDLGSWGPRSRRLAAMPADTPLAERCAAQWADCVAATDAAVARLPADAVLSIRYEELVAAPADVLARIVKFSGQTASDAAIRAAVAGVRATSVGKGAKAARGFSERVRALLAPALARHGYEEGAA